MSAPLPAQYSWLNEVGLLPRTIQEGLKLLGTAEVVGKGSNKTIIGWRDELNQNGVKIVGFSDDDIAWCGLLAAIVCFRRMKKADEVVEDPLWARNWAKFGVKAPVPSLGDVMVFKRGDGGHVGFYVAEDATAWHILGGNQSNKVSIARFSKAKWPLIACRRPPYKVPARSVKPYQVAALGTLATNAA